MKPKVNLAALPRWAIGALLALLFVVAPATSHLLDGPSDTDAAKATADDKADAISQAQQVAHGGEQP